MAHEVQDQEPLSVHLLSTWLRSASYDPRTQTLNVFLVGGRSYTLSGVPPDVFEDFISDASPGSYFNANLKGKY